MWRLWLETFLALPDSSKRITIRSLLAQHEAAINHVVLALPPHSAAHLRQLLMTLKGWE